MAIAMLQENRYILASFLLGSLVTMAIYYLILFFFRKNLRNRIAELELIIERKNEEIDELKSNEEKLKICATIDMMTGLLNRATGFATLEQQLLFASRYKWPLTVCFVDIDQLKKVNDTHGHRVGDDLIVSIGSILRRYTRKSDIVSRIGGDEFLVVFPKCTIAEAKEIWQRVIEKINEFNLENNQYQASLSNGFSQFSADDPACPSTVDALIEAADIDMYSNKNIIFN